METCLVPYGHAPHRTSAQHAHDEAAEAVWTVSEEALLVSAVWECRSRVILNDYVCHACS